MGWIDLRGSSGVYIRTMRINVRDVDLVRGSLGRCREGVPRRAKFWRRPCGTWCGTWAWAVRSPAGPWHAHSFTQNGLFRRQCWIVWPGLGPVDSCLVLKASPDFPKTPAVCCDYIMRQMTLTQAQVVSQQLNSSTAQQVRTFRGVDDGLVWSLDNNGVWGTCSGGGCL